MSHVPSRAIFRSVSEKAWEKIQNRNGEAILLLRPVDVQEILEEGFTPFTPAVSLIYALRRSDRHDTRGRIENKDTTATESVPKQYTTEPRPWD